VCCVPKIRSTVDTGTLHPPLVLPLIKNVIFHLFGSLMFMLCKRQVNIIQAHQRFDCRGRYFESIHLSLHISIVKVFFRLVLNARHASTRLAIVDGMYNSARGRIGQQMTYLLINNVAYRFST